MRKVLFVTSDSLYTSGAFRSMVKLCDLLRNTGEYMPYILLPKKGCGELILKKHNLDYKVIRSYSWTDKKAIDGTILAYLKKTVKYLLNQFAIKRISILIKQEKIDIVHINTIGTYVGGVAAIKNNLPYIWHIREALDADHNKYLIYDNSYGLINKANKIICISQYVYNHFSKVLDNEKLAVIYNGIDEREFYYKKSKEEFENNNNFLCIGNMTSNKGQEYIIRAAKKLARLNYDFHVTFVGGGEKKEHYIEMADEIKEYITFCEPNEDVRQYYLGAKVFIMSSEAEAFGRTTIEAMMSGCLIIGTNTGATSEILTNGENGLLYRYDNSDELSELMKSVLEGTEDYYSMMLSGQKHAIERFTAFDNMKRIKEEYDSVLWKDAAKSKYVMEEVG